MSRTKNSIANSLFGIAGSLLSVVISFVVRFILIKTLGEEINGLHNLFQNITNVLLLMELGISSAMIIHLYEPVTTGDEEQMAGILSFYRTVYRYIALAFFLTSIVVSLFFLKHLVHTTLPFHQVQLYFQLFNLTFVLNYLTNYKRSLLFAAQKNRVSVFFNSVAELTFRIVQILSLLMFKAYLFFLILTIVEKLMSNLLCNRYIDRHYPFLRQTGQELASSKRQAIMTTVKSLMLNNVAGTVQQSSRSLLISMLLGNISIVGYYGNYQLIISVVELIYSQIGGALTSSFGSLAIEKDQQRLQAAYKKAAFVLNWLAAICCAGFLICVQDFIQLLFGEGSLLEFSSVLLLTFGLMLYLLNIPIISLQNALGLHHLDAYYMLLQAGLAVAFGYVGGLVFGMAGIFAGMILPLLWLTVIRKGMVVSAYALGMSHRSYLSFLSYESLKILLVSLVAYFMVSCLGLNLSFMTLIIKAFLVLIVGLTLPAFLSSRQTELAYVWKLLQHRLQKK
ncbi:lipopolysaccharide biosynthesis protein [Streptococcus sp. E24BD]|uniref:lipopolysaccharide biosynthesis protein n=1 Tax=Streptococcus sp. E24BD TaxID=3278715 RepID=UPI00359E29EC